VSFRAPIICNTFTAAAKMAMAGLGAAFLPVSIYDGHLERGELRVIHCTPEVDPFDLYVVRPVAATRTVDRAIEDIALPFGERATRIWAELAN
jgi:DNA-binding transcriptional LysR family regulator